MDDRKQALRVELAQLLRQAAEVKVRLDRADGTVRGVPHYSVIERTAHELGQEVSRMVQAMHLAEIVDDGPQFARCPECETRCQLQRRKRQLRSGDGPVDLQELVGSCPCCRRDFFPAAREPGF